MAYEPQTWADGPDGGTPITAERLTHIEDGVAAAAATADDAAPASHTHDVADVTGLQNVITTLQNTVSDLTSRVAALEGDTDG